MGKGQRPEEWGQEWEGSVILNWEGWARLRRQHLREAWEVSDGGTGHVPGRGDGGRPVFPACGSRRWATWPRPSGAVRKQGWQQTWTWQDPCGYCVQTGGRGQEDEREWSEWFRRRRWPPHRRCAWSRPGLTRLCMWCVREKGHGCFQATGLSDRRVKLPQQSGRAGGGRRQLKLGHTKSEMSAEHLKGTMGGEVWIQRARWRSVPATSVSYRKAQGNTHSTPDRGSHWSPDLSSRGST